jgi:uncharacterized integral membrane protein
VDGRAQPGHDEGRNMFRKIITAIIVVPLVVIFVAFAVANRQTVTVSFDPFSSAAPAYAATLPLFVVIFAVLIIGVLIGGCAVWLRQGKWRRSARRLGDEVRALQAELDLKNARDIYRGHPLPSEPPPLPVIPPPMP